MNKISLLYFLAALSYVYPQADFAEKYSNCLETYCQLFDYCIAKAQPLFLNALNKYPLQDNSSIEDLFNWYNDFNMELSFKDVNKFILAQDASIFCLVSYNWYQDQINTNYYQTNFPQPSYQFLFINKLEYNTIPITQFPYQFLDCIQNWCYFDDSCFKINTYYFIQILASSQNQQNLQDWYNVFKAITNNPTITFCFIQYDWKQDFINKKQILIATNITEYQINNNQNNQNNNSSSNNNTNNNSNSNNNNSTSNNNNNSTNNNSNNSMSDNNNNLNNNNNSTNCKNNNNCPPYSQNGNGLVNPPSSQGGILKNIQFYILIICFTF